jgi:hypothetical protein
MSFFPVRKLLGKLRPGARITNVWRALVVVGALAVVGITVLMILRHT